MNIIPINDAEAIIEPFWDQELSGLKNWHIEPGDQHGLTICQNWFSAAFGWAKRPENGPVLCMVRECNVHCVEYDNLMISMTAPEGSIIRVSLLVELGKITFQTTPFPNIKKEIFVDLQGASNIQQIKIEIFAAEDEIGQGWFNWIGLQNSKLIEKHIQLWNSYDEKWEKYLEPESYEPSFQPAYGILIDKEETDILRAKHGDFLQKKGTSFYTDSAETLKSLTPEKRIGEFVNFWDDTRFARERDYGKELTMNGNTAVISGFVLKDKKLLRLGARFALATVMCEKWNDGMVCNFPGSNFDHRAFVKSLCCYQVALALDLAGDLFTYTGREFLKRKLAEEGIAGINFITWKHSYIFDCNQMAWFSSGRMYAYAVLEKSYSHVAPYTDIAYYDIVENIERSILADGGFVEGPTYFLCIGGPGGISIYFYSRLKGRKLEEVMPQRMKLTADYAEVLASTDNSMDVIPICDAAPYCAQESVAVMASLLPQSQWVNIFRKSLSRTGGFPSTLITCKLEQEIPLKGYKMKPFVYLNETGIMASVRKVEGEISKLLIMGNKAGAGHTHEDKGSFVIEFAGETFAMEPGQVQENGMIQYGNPLSEVMKHCQRHNMLVPSGTDERPHPQNPIQVDVKPNGYGDMVSFNAEMDLTPGWEEYYRTWVRRWSSPTPDVLIISDDYQLEKGDGVEFYWITKQEVIVRNDSIILQGKRGQLIIDIPEDCSVRVDELPFREDEIHKRIALCKKAIKGRLEVKILLAK